MPLTHLFTVSSTLLPLPCPRLCYVAISAFSIHHIVNEGVQGCEVLCPATVGSTEDDGCSFRGTAELHRTQLSLHMCRGQAWSWAQESLGVGGGTGRSSAHAWKVVGKEVGGGMWQ